MRSRAEDDPEDVVLRLVQEHAAELLRFARRFSMCADDAHDAYQRSLEILVRRMRTDPPTSPLSWLRTVIRNECVTVREQREQLVGYREVDLDRHEGRHLEDPAERVAGFEHLRHTAEALQRLKPQEITALVLRAEGHSYREIAERNQWSYTKVNRCVTEGRRALVARIGAIESGAECERWLPLLSALADGEASRHDVAELRPHLRSCPACRAVLRDFHRAPGEVAALVPLALVPLAGDPGGAVARHAETAVHALLERVTLAAMRMQSAFDALPGAKLAAVAASTVAVAGGSVAIQHATQGSGAAAAATTAVHGSASIRPANGLAVAALLPRSAPPRRATDRSPGGSVSPPRAAAPGEFTPEGPVPQAASDAAASGAAASPGTAGALAAPSASAATQPNPPRSAPSSSPQDPSTEFAGP